MTANTSSSLDRWFHLSARGSDVKTEVRGGFVTFITMAYIVVLNPLIIGTAKDVNGNFPGGGQDVGAAIALVAAATALIAGLLTIFMGVYGRFPIALAAGLGLNGFLAFGLAPTMTWGQAFGLVVLEGIIVLVLVLTGFRTAVFHAVPDSLKYSIGAGIGLFIALIGLVDSGVVRGGVPLITFGVYGELAGWPLFTFIAGLLLMIVLVARHVRGGILIGLVSTTVLAIVLETVFTIGPDAKLTIDEFVYNPGSEHELRAGAIARGLWPNSYVTLGHALLSEFREYERTLTACMNSFVRPKVQAYVDNLDAELAGRRHEVRRAVGGGGNEQHHAGHRAAPGHGPPAWPAGEHLPLLSLGQRRAHQKSER